jgi:MFS family permease
MYVLDCGCRLTTVCKEYYQFALAQGVLFGIASGLVFHPAMASPGQWFAERRALALGAAVSGAGVGGTLWPIALKRMIDQIGEQSLSAPPLTAGFPWTIRAVGFISLGLLACSCALIRTRLPRTQPPPWSTLLAPCKEAPFVLLSLSVGVVYFGMFIPFFYITSYASLLGAESNLAFYCSSFINAGSVVGRLFAGIGDYLGAFNTLSITGCMSGLLVLVWWVPLNSVGALIGFGVLYGAFAGMYISIIMPCIAQLSTQHDFGSRVGLLWGIVSVFMLTGPSAGGALLGTDQAGYRHAGALSGAVVLGGSFLAIAARLCQDKRLRAII